MGMYTLLLSFALTVYLVNSAVILDDDVEQQGLYSKSDQVTILTKANFERKIYGQRFAQVVQFYNSYCGHCRSFYPKFRSLAFEIVPWNKIFRLSVIDCFNDDNNEICRDFEIMSYPSLRYLHENFVREPHKLGQRLTITDTSEKLKNEIIKKMQSEQLAGRFLMGPYLNIMSYTSYLDVLHDVAQETLYTFLVFEDYNSTIGAEVALDISAYEKVTVKRVSSNSKLAEIAAIKMYPSVVVVGKTAQPMLLASNIPSEEQMLVIIRQYLTTHNYDVPKQEIKNDTVTTEKPNNHIAENSLKVFYSDLEVTVRSVLHTEINHLPISGVAHQALTEFLEALRDNFPFKGNQRFRAFIVELLFNIQSVSTWTSTDIDNLIKNLENKHNPYISKTSDYIGCKGSQPKYRGYTCGLWTLFHTMTVTAANSNGDGPKVLRAMHSFVKHFFGCTHCVEHFLAMAERNRLFDVKDNDRAVLWLWVSHNEVNLRLAGDYTEDPVHPKIQFPSVYQCPQCRLINGAWKLPEVYQYLLTFYNSERIQEEQDERSAAPVFGQLSNLDLGMLSFLYLLSFIIIIVVIRLFLTRRFYRKRVYKHGWGKV